MPLEQIIVLSFIQGLTEFLPVSSSGHLIILPVLTGWPDQGLVTDVMVHLGSLLAILVYFWRDILRLIGGVFDLIRFRWSENAKLLTFIIAATVPIIIGGVVLKMTGLLDHFRGVNGLKIVGWNALIFGALLYITDSFGLRIKTMADMRFGSALAIGIAQVLALIPGASRSGVTITVARSLGFRREDATRFSFLLGIPAISGAGLLTIFELEEKGATIPPDALLAAGLTFFAALGAIAFLMALVKRMNFLPFVLYRFVLGSFLLVFVYS